MLGTIPWGFDNPFSSSVAVFFPWDRILPPTNHTLFTPAAARHNTASVSLNWGELLGIETDGSTRAKERQGLEYYRAGNFFCLCSGDVGGVMDCLGRPFSFLWTTFFFFFFFSFSLTLSGRAMGKCYYRLWTVRVFLKTLLCSSLPRCRGFASENDESLRLRRSARASERASILQARQRRT
ncbi:hypothetical protein IWX49DRAFT_176704 [Phyllosticta citricarpa]